MISHISDTELGRIDLELTCKPPSQGLALVVPEDAMQAAKGKEKSTVLLSYKTYEPQ